MYKPLYLVSLLLAAHGGRAQSCTVANTPGQTQAIHDANCIELRGGFDCASEVEITITPPLATVGQWAQANWGISPSSNNVFIGIHTSVLPNGLVISWLGHNDNQHATQTGHPGTDMYRWHPRANQLIGPVFHVDWTNAFCTGHSFLKDGRLLVTGGHDKNVEPAGSDPGYALGLQDVNTYDYAADQNAVRPNTGFPGEPVSWVRAGFMEHRRWYPTNTTLNDGRVLITSGETEPQRIISDNKKYPEIWDNGVLTKLEGAPGRSRSTPGCFRPPTAKCSSPGPTQPTPTSI